MPYLPVSVLNVTAFPHGNDADIATQIRMLKERYERSHPLLAYYPLKKVITTGGGNTIIGAVNTTKFDQLWGEAVDSNLTEWKQPHLSGDTDAAHSDVEQFASAIPLNGKLQRTAQELDLKRWGFDKGYDLIVTIPLPILDEKVITVTQGDKIIWNEWAFKVEQFAITGWWKNTNVPLYAVLNCKNHREGA